MGYWLVKTEPSEYSFDDFMRDWQTAWSGVTSPAALKNLRDFGPDDPIIVYHTGNEKRAVGLAKVLSFGDPPFVQAERKLTKPVPLADIKAHPLFKDSPLVKQGRLSVVALDWRQFKAILEMGKTKR